MNSITESEAYFILNLLPNIGPVRVKRLRERFGTASAALVAGEYELRGVEGIGEELARKIRSWRETVRAEEEMRRATELGLRVVAFPDADYPPVLREIYDPPLVLYTKGTVPSRWPKGIAVVGSRKTTQYGLEMAKKLSYQLAYAGVPIISGLARGIDTVAHQAALAAKGVTWGVLGCGLDQMYPPENQALADRMTEAGGCLFSEFVLGMPPDRRTFPMRNRIVSGLSFGVLVVEAGLESGALITARQASEQGRQVFAVPGRIDNPQARGCHLLIKEGAALIEGVEDVLQSLEFLIPQAEFTVPRSEPVNLSPAESLLFSALSTEETPIDELIEKTQLSSREVSSTLMRLEMKKLVKQLPGKLFVRTA